MDMKLDNGVDMCHIIVVADSICLHWPTIEMESNLSELFIMKWYESIIIKCTS